MSRPVSPVTSASVSSVHGSGMLPPLALGLGATADDLAPVVEAVDCTAGGDASRPQPAETRIRTMRMPRRRIMCSSRLSWSAKSILHRRSQVARRFEEICPSRGGVTASERPRSDGLAAMTGSGGDLLCTYAADRVRHKFAGVSLCVLHLTFTVKTKNSIFNLTCHISASRLPSRFLRRPEACYDLLR